jgi:hypothetical protein
MPCVLPVLAMKLGSLVQTERRERGGGAAAVPRLGMRDRRLVPGAGADDDRATR